MITERQQVAKKYWNEDLCAYVYRMPNAANGTEIHRHIWFAGNGRTGHWTIQLIDCNDDQMGDARYAANKGCLATTVEHSYTTPDYF